jgi:hypothetical protein
MARRFARRGASAWASFASLASLAALTFSGGALAQPSAAAVAKADALFNEALALIERGRYSEACPKLAESQALDPGIGTLYNLSDCNERIGRTATAWSGFLEVSSLANAAGQQPRVEDARRRAAALEPKLSKLQIAVPAAAASVAGLEVRRDGAVLPRAEWGKDVPVDPGKHVVAAEAPGQPSWSKEVRVDQPGKVVLVEVPALGSDSASGDASAPSEGRSLVPAFVLGGVALAGIGAGVGLIVASSSKEANRDALRESILQSSGEQGTSSCHSSLSASRRTTCDELESAAKSAPALKGAAIGAFVGGGLAAAGVLGYLLWPSPSKEGAEAGFNVRVAPLIAPPALARAADGAFVGAVAAGSF